MNTEHNPEDYVLVHKTKAKLSRARKMVIGVMAVGAVSALAGAGTFASFSASTTNDGVFRTGRLVLSNSVDNGNVCFSSGTAANNVATGDATLDENDTNCSTLFSNDLRPGQAATANVAVSNDSNSSYVNGALFFFGTDEDGDADGICDSTANDSTFEASPGTPETGSGNICEAIEITVQELVSGNPTNRCIFPENDAAACPDIASKAANAALTASAALTNLDLNFSGATVSNTDPLYVGPLQRGGTDRVFRINVRMKDNGFTSTGLGQDNVYQNLKPDVKLRWLLQDYGTSTAPNEY